MKRLKILAFAALMLPVCTCFHACGDDEDDEIELPGGDPEPEPTPDPEPDPEPEPDPTPQYTVPTAEDLYGVWQCVYNRTSYTEVYTNPDFLYNKVFVSDSADIAKDFSGMLRRTAFLKSPSNGRRDAAIFGYGSFNAEKYMDLWKAGQETRYNDDGVYINSSGDLCGNNVLKWEIHDDGKESNYGREVLVVFYGESGKVASRYHVDRYDGNSVWFTEFTERFNNTSEIINYESAYKLIRVTNKTN